MALRLSGLPALPDWQDGLARLVPALQAHAGGGMSSSANDRANRHDRRRHRRRLRGPADGGDAGALRPPRGAGRARAVQAVGAALGPHADRRGRARRAGGRRRGRRAISPSPTRRSRRWPGRSSSSCACPTPQSADGSADLSYVEAAAKEIASSPGARRHRRQQVDRARRLGQHGRAGDRPPRHQRRLQPRVPPRGHGGARQPQSGPDRGGCRRRRGRRPRSGSCSRPPGRR